MDISISYDELRKRTLFVATPMYGGMCHGLYTKSIADLAASCASMGIEMRLFYLFNESLITRGRNYAVDEFLRSKDNNGNPLTHMMFIDGDIGFEAKDVLTLLAMADHTDPTNPYDVICGPYPKKCISWEKIVMAVNKGMADEDPNVLDKYVGDYVFNVKDGTKNIPIGEPAEVLEGGTGFMMIKRQTFEKYQTAYPELMYKPDHVRTAQWDGSREIMAFFDTEIDPTTKRYLSEDYMFCQRTIKMGGRIWLCPWMKMVHVGSFVFGGSLADIAAIGASPTADQSLLKNKKKG